MTPHEALVAAINATDFSISRIEGLFNQFNDPEWPDSISGPIRLAREYLAINRIAPTPSVAEDYVNLVGILNQVEWPVASGADAEADARLFDLQDRVGRLVLNCVAIVAAAREMGISYAQPETLHPDGLRVPKTGHARALDLISRQVDDLEFHIEQLGSDEGTGNAPQRQQVLVINYRSAASRSIQTIRVAIATGTSLALDVIQRASASLVITTKQFLATIQAAASKASPQLRKAVNALRQPVQTVARSIGALIKRVAAQAEVKPEPLPDDFAQQARAMILSGTAPPASWVPHLVKLDFNGTALADLAPLASLSALQSLDLGNTEVSDITPLASLAALKSLELMRTEVSDITPLANLAVLQSLKLWSTEVSDITPLASLAALQTLDLSLMQVSDITPLANLAALQNLDLAGTQVRDITPLANLAALQSLDLSSTQVSDIAPLASLAALQTLDLKFTQVSDITPLANLAALQTLTLGSTEVSDISHLSDHADLTIRVENTRRAAALRTTLRAGSQVNVQRYR
ncbi:leucine-rich repeat domain-containing protein [Novosphingobium sp.]|uniref:leucine-rich repeat domain-containing protein n=1 Tax=Novosphingobium sp. TaxID=1874826 RepID=UPI00261FD169|nr:leucine-rich repeat domain-containing protein [Novosphingobium sp.]